MAQSKAKAPAAPNWITRYTVGVTGKWPNQWTRNQRSNGSFSIGQFRRSSDVRVEIHAWYWSDTYDQCRKRNGAIASSRRAVSNRQPKRRGAIRQISSPTAIG